MTSTTPAQELTQAAAVIRAAAEAAGSQRLIADHHPEGTIVHPEGSTRSIFQLHADGPRPSGTPCVTQAMGDWIALASPTLGTALAAWLEAEARVDTEDRAALIAEGRSPEAEHNSCTPDMCTTEAALAVARLINQEQQ